MSTCWKCGAELPEGKIECREECLGAKPKKKREKRVPIKWEKVKKLKDVIDILSEMGIAVDANNKKACEKLKHFL